MRTQGVIPGAQLQTGHIGKTNDLAIGARLDDDVTELFHRAQTTLGIDQSQKIAARHGLGAQLAGGHLHVLFAHGAHHIRRGQTAGGNLVRVQPGTHGIVTPTENLGIAHTANPRQRITDMQAGIVAQVKRVVAAVRGSQVHHHQEGGRLLLGGDPLPPHILGQPCQRLAHPVLYPHGGIVRIDIRAERHRHLQHTIGPGHGLEVHHPLNAVDGFLQRRGHGFGNHLGVGAGVHRTYHHRRRHHFRVFTHRQAGQRDQAHRKNDDRQHRGKDRPVDEKTREIHGKRLLSAVPTHSRALSFPCRAITRR